MHKSWLIGIVATVGACGAGAPGDGGGVGVSSSTATASATGAGGGAYALPSCNSQARPTGRITVDESAKNGWVTVLVDGVPLCSAAAADISANWLFGGPPALPLDVPFPLTGQSNSDPMPADGDHPTNSDPMPATGK